MKRYAFWLAAPAAFALPTGACTSDSPTGVPAIRIDVAPSPVRLETDETRQLTATVRSTSGAVIDHATVTWSSTSALVATVTQAGLVTAVGKGTTQIHARSEEHTSELQSLAYLVCRLLLEKKKTGAIDV